MKVKSRRIELSLSDIIMALAQKLLHQGPGSAASLQAASWELEADTSKWLMPSNI